MEVLDCSVVVHPLLKIPIQLLFILKFKKLMNIKRENDRVNVYSDDGQLMKSRTFTALRDASSGNNFIVLVFSQKVEVRDPELNYIAHKHYSNDLVSAKASANNVTITTTRKTELYTHNLQYVRTL